GDFHRVRDAVFIAARTMKMPDPVVKPAEGDHLIISFAGRDHEGRPVDPVAYCRRIQSLVHDMFQDRPFYDYKKVDMHHLDFRLLGRKFGNRNPDRLIRSLMDRFNLNAEPLIKLVANDRLILDIPNRDRRGRQIDPSEVRHYLERVGLKTEPAGAPTVET
ncbi:MAG: hypothetical protein HYU99_06105, partial [Deltaproteobacteria bacterium]|nr:hypothetical protein [Deltaproteobacteria bacterium]